MRDEKKEYPPVSGFPAGYEWDEDEDPTVGGNNGMLESIKKYLTRKKYVSNREYRYYSPRYDKWVVVPKGYLSDGATGAMDINSMAWWVHDVLCEFGVWEDGTPVTNWQASTVLSDILFDEGRYIRATTWWPATWLFGGQKARENGMW